MIDGKHFVAGLPRKTKFYDKSKLMSYELARLAAEQFVEDPVLLDRARSFVNRHMKPDPHQSKYYRMWIDLLSEEPREIARRLLADSPEGDLLRDTMPVFRVASPEERLATLELANSEHYQIVVAR